MAIQQEIKQTQELVLTELFFPLLPEVCCVFILFDHHLFRWIELFLKWAFAFTSAHAAPRTCLLFGTGRPQVLTELSSSLPLV